MRHADTTQPRPVEPFLDRVINMTYSGVGWIQSAELRIAPSRNPHTDNDFSCSALAIRHGRHLDAIRSCELGRLDFPGTLNAGFEPGTAALLRGGTGFDDI